MSETALSRSIRKALTASGVWVVRVQSGTIPATYKGTKRFIHCAEPGTPDLCLVGLGWLEVKGKGGRLGIEQKHWHSRAAAQGVKVAVVRSVREALNVVEEWKR